MINRREEDNLYRLFKAVKSISDVECFDDQQTGFSYIKHNGFEWPNMSYLGTQQYSQCNFELLVNKVKAQIFPRLFILNQTVTQDQAFYEKLSLNKFIIGGQWVNMFLDLSEYQDQAGDAKLAEVKSFEEVADWTACVSQSLFNGKPLDANVFYKGIEAGIFRLFAKILDGRIIATSLAFIAVDGPGIYMVSTHPQFRKRGFGNEIMNFTLNQLKISGYNKVELQSTRDGLSLYSKIGFQQNALLPLYYCVI